MCRERGIEFSLLTVPNVTEHAIKWLFKSWNRGNDIEISMNPTIETVRKTAFAFLVGPIALAPAIIIPGIVYSLFAGSLNDFSGTLSIGVIAIFYGFAIAYPIALTIGVPSVLILDFFGKLGLIPLIVICTVVVSLISIWANVGFIGWLFLMYCAMAVCLGCWLAFKYY